MQKWTPEEDAKLTEAAEEETLGSQLLHVLRSNEHQASGYLDTDPLEQYTLGGHQKKTSTQAVHGKRTVNVNAVRWPHIEFANR
jgi:hypothetical protein